MVDYFVLLSGFLEICFEKLLYFNFWHMFLLALDHRYDFLLALAFDFLGKLFVQDSLLVDIR